MYVNYFRQWSFAFLLAGAILMLAHLTDTTWPLAMFFLAGGLIVGALSLARSLGRFLRRHDHDPRYRGDEPWPGAEGFP